MKTAIIVGHTQLKQGAYSPYLNQSEWQFNTTIADLLKDVTTTFFYDTYNWGYTTMVKRLAQRINTQNFDLILELHFNASKSSKANGCEALYYFENSTAKQLGTYYCQLMEQELGLKKRGAKGLRNKEQRGFAALFYPKPTTLILEPFFGTNPEDCKKINPAVYTTIIKEVINHYKKEL